MMHLYMNRNKTIYWNPDVSNPKESYEILIRHFPFLDIDIFRIFCSIFYGEVTDNDMTYIIILEILTNNIRKKQNLKLKRELCITIKNYHWLYPPLFSLITLLSISQNVQELNEIGNNGCKSVILKNITSNHKVFRSYLDESKCNQFTKLTHMIKQIGINFRPLRCEQISDMISLVDKLKKNYYEFCNASKIKLPCVVSDDKNTKYMKKNKIKKEKKEKNLIDETPKINVDGIIENESMPDNTIDKIEIEIEIETEKILENAIIQKSEIYDAIQIENTIDIHIDKIKIIDINETKIEIRDKILDRRIENNRNKTGFKIVTINSVARPEQTLQIKKHTKKEMAPKIIVRQSNEKRKYQRKIMSQKPKRNKQYDNNNNITVEKSDIITQLNVKSDLTQYNYTKKKEEVLQNVCVKPDVTETNNNYNNIDISDSEDEISPITDKPMTTIKEYDEFLEIESHYQNLYNKIMLEQRYYNKNNYFIKYKTYENGIEYIVSESCSDFMRQYGCHRFGQRYHETIKSWMSNDGTKCETIEYHTTSTRPLFV